MSRARTTTMTTINQGDVENLPVPLPKISDQSAFADKLDQLEQVSNEIIAQKEAMVHLRNDLCNWLV